MPIQITLHLFSVLPALVLGAFIVSAKKGTNTHKTIGRVWVGLMLFTSVTSFFITDEGAFSWIHILSVITIVSLLVAVWAIRNGRVDIHKHAMEGSFIGSVIAGVFASILPGRVVYGFLFG